MDDNNRLIKTTIYLFFFSAITSLVSFGKEVVFASYFGVSADADAFVIASQVPIILFSVISVAINTVLIPIYSKKIYNEGVEKADFFLTNLINIVFIFSCVFSIIGIVIAEYIIYLFAPGLSNETHCLATSLLRIILPSVILTGLNGCNIGILNVHKSFVLPKLAVNFKNIVYILFIILMLDSYGIYAASMGFLLGSIVEFLYLYDLVRKKYKYRFYINIRDPDLKKSMKMTGPIFLGIGAAQINRIVDKVISSFLRKGSISSLNYASKLSNVFSGLLINSISTIMYPYFAEKVAKEEFDDLGKIYILTLSFYILVTIPIICGSVLLREELVSVVFGRGAFGFEAVELTSLLFTLYMVGILFSAVRQTGAKLFYAFGDTKTPMKNSLYGIVLNIVLNLILSRFIGVAGLALATTASNGLICFLLTKDSKIKLKTIKFKSIIIVFLKSSVSSFMMILVVFLLKALLVGNELILLILSCTLVGGIVYIVMLYIFKTQELTDVINLLRRKKNV